MINDEFNITVQIAFYKRYALFLASLERRAGGFFGGGVVFFKKIFDFFQKNNAAPIELFDGRLLSEAKNSPYCL